MVQGLLTVVSGCLELMNLLSFGLIVVQDLLTVVYFGLVVVMSVLEKLLICVLNLSTAASGGWKWTSLVYFGSMVASVVSFPPQVTV